MTKSQWRLLGAILALAGCDDGEKGGGATCGAGTTNADGVCLPDAPVDGTPGDGDGDPEPGDGDVGDGEPDSTCGAGTVEMDGECVPEQSAPIALNGFTVTRLALETRGRALTGSDDDPSVRTFHPVDVTVAVRYEGDPATIPLVVALGEAGASGEGDEGFCMLGGIAVEHTGSGEVVVKKRLFMSEDCLREEDGAVVDSRAMNPVLLIDPDRLLRTKVTLPPGIIFSAARQSEAVAALAAYNDALSAGETPEPLSADVKSLAECAPAPGGDAASCALDVTVEKSAGVDFELTEVALESSVLVLNKCFDTQAELDAYAAAVVEVSPGVMRSMPTGYVCNRSIVRGLDEAGQPLPYGDVKDFTYGAADVDVDTTVTSFGIDDSPVESADELLAMGSMTEDGFQLDVKPEDIANNALGADESYQVRYFLRPGSQQVFDPSQDSSLAAGIARSGGFANLVTAKKLLPIYLHAQGEQAKADEEGSPSGQVPSTLEETVSIPMAPSEYTHGLYVENDCGRFNDPARAADYRDDLPACNDQVNPRDDMLYGDYADETEFFVVACLAPAEGATLPDSDELDNNCVERAVRVARVAPREKLWADQNPGSADSNPYADDIDDVAQPGYTQDSLFAAGDAVDGFAANNDFDQFIGNEHVSFNFHAHSYNALTLQNGASTDNEAKMWLRSGTLDVTLDLVRVWAVSSAKTIVVGSYADYGLAYFGVQYAGERKELEYHKEWDWNVTKKYEKTKSIFAKVCFIDLGFKIEGQAGFRIDLDVVARELPGDDATCELGAGTCECSTPECSVLKSKFPNAEAIGEASVTLTPYGSVKANVYAAVSVVIARAGAAGEMTLAQIGVPAKAALNWGFDGSVRAPQDGTLRLATWANLRLESTFMRGRLYLFAENMGPDWCEGWFGIPYPCGWGWHTFWDMTLASWDGWTYNQLLWASPVYTAELTRQGLSIPPPGIQPNLDYRIQPAHSNKCLDSWQGGGGVVQYDCTGVPNQRWRFEDMGNGQYLLRDNLRRECVDVLHGGTQNGFTSITYPCHKLNNQRFRLESRGADTYLLKYVHSGKCVEIGGWNQNNNAKANQWDCHGGSNQLFKVSRW